MEISYFPWGGTGNVGVPSLGNPLPFPWVGPVLRCTSWQERARFVTPKMPFKRREGAEGPSRLAGPLYWGFPRWIPTAACPSMWGVVWEKSKQKSFLFFPFRTKSCPEIAHYPDEAGSWRCTVRGGCYWERWEFQGILSPSPGRRGALPLPLPVISSGGIRPLSCLFLSISPRPERTQPCPGTTPQAR